MGRERPRLQFASAAPRSIGGVAHAPHVSVGDVLGSARWMVAEMRVKSLPVFLENTGRKGP